MEVMIDASGISLLAESFSLDMDLRVNNTYIDIMLPSTFAPVYPPGVLSMRIKASCGENLFGENCSVTCIAREDDNGHFTCNANGDRECSPGFCSMENNCTVECNECEDNPCQNGGGCLVSL